ncbi:MAG: glycerophosphodiester phosphodiesterase family protein [Herbiconiux sp.]|nr:glycerophosphodiester phosphodiesterase family protein [Herbiconiux sp.]
MLAHRGLAIGVPENTEAAFVAALAAGATHLETDVNASADGVAVVSHDPGLDRVAPGRTERVDALTVDQLRRIDLGGGAVFPTLFETLTAHPEAFVNIDIKSDAVALPAARAIQDAGARGRVLVTSFSRRRRLEAVSALGGDVATSASAVEFVPALLFAKLGLTPLVRLVLRRVDAVQIPRSIYGLDTTTPATLRRLHAAGVEVHVWTVNDVAVAERLLVRGVDGIVTDRADLMLPIVQRFRSEPAR